MMAALHRHGAEFLDGDQSITWAGLDGGRALRTGAGHGRAHRGPSAVQVIFR